MTPAWSNRYIGIRYRWRASSLAGCCCVGLARLVYSDELAINDFPIYDEASKAIRSPRDRASVAAALGHAAGDWPWRPVSAAQAFDLLIFGAGGIDDHIGIVVDPAACLFLHIRPGTVSGLDDYAHAPWRELLRGTYRHDSMGGQNG